MMVRSKRCSTKRPDTLMQLSRSSLSEIRLATHGRAIHPCHIKIELKTETDNINIDSFPTEVCEME